MRNIVSRERLLAACCSGVLAAALLVPTPALAADPYPRLPGEPAPLSSGDARRISEAEAAKLAAEWAKFGKDPTTEVVVDTVIGVITVGYPPAGAALGFAWSLVKSGQTDGMAAALKHIDTRLAAIDARLVAIESDIDALRDITFKQANINRLRELKARRDTVLKLRGQLELGPASQARMDEIALEATLLVDRFLDTGSDERDLWQWNDRLRVRSDPANPRKLRGELLPAAFRPDPALDYYVAALAVWVAAIELQGGGNADAVRLRYRDKLLQHAAHLSVRPHWRELDEPPLETRLPEMLMAGITCGQTPVSRYPDAQGRCAFATYCTDQFALAYKAPAGTGSFAGPSQPGALCTLARRVPRDDAQRRALAREPGRMVYGTAALETLDTLRDTAEEEERESRWGLGAMTVMADLMVKLARTGSSRDAPVGVFDATQWDRALVYTVNPTGELEWRQFLYGRRADGSWAWKWQGPVPVGTGWKVSDIVPVYSGEVASTQRFGVSLVALYANGGIRWLRHDGANDGAQTWAPAADFTGDWLRYERRLGGDDGAVYAIASDGKVHRIGARNPASRGAPVTDWLAPVDTGANGWQSALHAFRAGNETFYAVLPDGSLNWYRHAYPVRPARTPGTHALGSRNRVWQGGRPVAPSGWQAYRAVFATGRGSIFALTSTGDLLWFRHEGFMDGSGTVSAPVTVATGWNSVQRIVPVVESDRPLARLPR